MISFLSRTYRRATPPQRYWFLVTALLLAALLSRPLALAMTPMSLLPDVVDYLYDDAYYYLGIAANVAEHGESTLDGVTRTNGYHPMWLLMLAALAALVGVEPWPLFVATVALVALIAGGGVLLALRWRRHADADLAWLSATGVAITVLQYPSVFLLGMEPIVALLAFVPLVVALETAPERRSLITLSALLALMFVTRIDGLSLFGVCALLLLVEQRPRGQWRTLLPKLLPKLLKLSAIVVPVALAYFLINIWLFDSAVPVSGLAKRIGGPTFANWGVLPDFLGRAKPLLALLSMLAALEFTAWRAGCWTSKLWKAIAVFGLSALVQALYYSSQSTWLIWTWYIWLTALTSALVIARIVHLSLALLDRPRLRLVAIAALATLLLFEAAKVRSYSADAIARIVRSDTLAAAPRSDEALSYNQLSIDMLGHFFTGSEPLQVAMGDRAGGLAYWGRRQLTVVQTEGLTLDAAYARARLEGNAESYFEQGFRIRYWIVDREVLPAVTQADGRREYLVVDPIQGRITVDPLPTFCFDDTALKYQRSYGQPPLRGTRHVFDFARRRPCSPAALALRDAALAGDGMRRLSLPSEYDQVPGGFLDTAAEARDRRLALARHMPKDSAREASAGAALDGGP